MKVGDIIQEKQPPRRKGLIVEFVEVFRSRRRQPPLNEIIVLLTNGTLFYADPFHGEPIIEV